MSVNQYIKPITAEVKNDNLYIGGCSTIELIKKYGSPLYVIDETTLRTVCREYITAFKSYPNISILYASKALATSAIFKIVTQEGLGLDVVSGGEVYTAYKAGIDMSKLMFNGNNKQEWELETAIDTGVGRISVDNFHDIELLGKITADRNKTVNILLRITPGIDCHTHEYIQTGHLDSKFGFDLTQVDDAVRLIKENYPKIKIKGLHAHIGSQIFDTAGFIDEIKILVRELARINSEHSLKLSELNLGGGLGVKYIETDTPPDIKEVAKIIIKTLLNEIEENNLQDIKLYIEPGRSVISTSGVTLYTVGAVKQVPHGTKYVSVDGGMADNPRPAMYQAEYTCDCANKMNTNECEFVTIAGRYCESGDILIKNVSLPPLTSGDILCVYNTGAYNYSMASNYNRVQKTGMVLVNNSQSDIIVYRETLEDLISHDNIPDRLK